MDLLFINLFAFDLKNSDCFDYLIFESTLSKVHCYGITGFREFIGWSQRDLVVANDSKTPSSPWQLRSVY